MDRSRRIVLLGVLLALTLGLCVHFGATYDRNWPHPTGEQLAEDPAGWDGERVLLFGEVQERTADGLVMTVEDDSETVVRTVTVRGADVSVQVGGVVQVYGRLSERGTVQRADSIVVVNESPSDGQYKLLTSLLGGMLAAGLFLRHWRIDPREFAFRARKRGEDDG
ncbi:DNA-binding protein [Halovenus sp. WSH3]|uniref:DNA-binding protein n=1 Tax=Halovenus carboxidivorans TaxID=2692199 RepID=A0A6B0TB50_9EURY|nr:DNA-binding protein [Halovenus carboxidivorans]MXR50409.1 DNA-binding protein [Halovenus carboxidivorans]